MFIDRLANRKSRDLKKLSGEISMKPSKIKPGEKLSVQTGFAVRSAYFVRRVPAQGGRKAVNYLRFPDFAGMEGPEDDGVCEMSDYEVSRTVERGA